MKKNLATFILIIASVVVAFFIGFPYFSRAKMGGKPSPARLKVMQEKEKERNERFVDPILRAIHDDRAEEVRSLWARYAEAGYVEDPLLRL